MGFLNSSNIKDLGTYKNTDHFLNSIYEGCLKNNVRLLARGERVVEPPLLTDKHPRSVLTIDSCHMHDPTSAFDFLCYMTVAMIKII